MTDLEPLRDAIRRLGHLSVYYDGDKPRIGSKAVTLSAIAAAEKSPEFVAERFRDVTGQLWLWITFAAPIGPAFPAWAHTRGW